MTELADVQDLGSCVERREGSSPFFRTQWRKFEPAIFFQKSVCGSCEICTKRII